MQDAHAAHVRSADEVYRLTDDWVLALGAHLRDVKARCRPGQWRRWADLELPFPREYAERAIAAVLAVEMLPDDVREHLPAPWQAFFVRTHPVEPARAAQIRSVGPVRAHPAPDVAVAALLDLDPAELSPEMAAKLREWLDSALIAAT